MVGTVEILNVGEGDTKLSFDPKNPKERERAARIVSDLVRRGYALLVEIERRDGEPIYRRAHAFDPETHEYVIFGDEAVPIEEPVALRRKGRPARRVPAEKARVVAVGRTAGG